MDRDKLDALGVELKASGEERLLMEQETLYRALACPSDELLLTCHAIDASGGETRPSYFIGTVRDLLPNVPFSTHRTETVRDRLQAERPAVELRVRIFRATGHRPSRLPMPFIRMTSASKTRGAAAPQRTAERCAHHRRTVRKKPQSDRFACGYVLFLSVCILYAVWFEGQAAPRGEV